MSKKGAFIYQQIELTTAEWSENTTVYPASVWLFERLESGRFNMKLSDGVHSFSDLPAVMQDVVVSVKTDTPTEYVLEIITAAGTFTTPNLKGRDGESYDDTEVRRLIAQVEALARGKSRAQVFDTVEALDAWLAVADNAATLQIGDNLLVRQSDVPDYWWDGTAKQKLETEKVDLTPYVTKAELDGLLAFRSGQNELTTLANIPTTKAYATATLSAASDLSIDESGRALQIGEQIYLSCMPSVAFTQPIPTSGSFRSMSGSSIATTANVPFEMSVLKIADSGVMYSIMIKEQE